jgi:tripartite-type tricarboxylate transporter receptor subunit TctC
LDELGVKGYEATTFTGLFVPAGTPPAAFERLVGSLKKALQDNTVRERYRGMGVDLIEMSQPEFAAYVRDDYEKWKRVAREGNIVVD